MEQIVSGVAIAVISGIFLHFLGFSSPKTTVIVQNGKVVSRTWKLLKGFGWLMFVGGGYYFLAWLSVDGFTDPRTGIGLSVCVLGLLFFFIGKVWSWFV